MVWTNPSGISVIMVQQCCPESRGLFFFLAPHQYEACTQIGSYDDINIHSNPQVGIFLTPSLSRRMIRASWCTWWCTHCPYVGRLNNCSRKPWSRCWTELRLQCHCVSTERDGGMGVNSHRLGCHNLRTRIRCSDGMSGVRGRNGNRNWHGGGVGSVHLLHSSVLCTLPLTSGSVGIALGGSRRLATSTRVVCRSRGSSVPARLVSVP